MDNPRHNSNQHSNQDHHEKKPKKGVVIITIIIILVVAIILGYGYFWNKMNKLNQTKIDLGDIKGNALSEQKEVTMSGYTQIAVFGIDNRTNGDYGSGNSDTIMIASINNETRAVKLVSVYRDTYLCVHDDYYGKANAAYAYKGAVAGLSMLNKNFDLNLNQYVSVDWYAVVDVIDLLGGVEIEITEAERQKINEYAPEVEKVTGITTSRVQESGLVHLDGVQAMAYMRIRKLAGNDYMRTQRQRMVIEAVFNQIKQAELSTINNIIDEVFPRIETNLTLTDILGLAMNVGRYQIVSTTGFPFEKDTMVLSGVGDCVVPITLEKNVTKLHKYLFGQAEEEVSSEVVEISQQIINRTGLDIGSSYVDTDSYTTGEWIEE